MWGREMEADARWSLWAVCECVRLSPGLQGRHGPASCRPPAYIGRVEQHVHKNGHGDHAAQTKSSLL